MVALDIFTGKKLEDICPSTHNMNVPNVTRKDYQMVNIDDGFAELMDDDGEPKDDLKIPDDDVGNDVPPKFTDGEQFSVTVLSALVRKELLVPKSLPPKLVDACCDGTGWLHLFVVPLAPSRHEDLSHITMSVIFTT